MTKKEILSTLDSCLDNKYWEFITLNDPYAYMVDSLEIPRRLTWRFRAV